MKYVFDFHELEWLWTLIIGLPLFAAAVWVYGSRAKSSLRWRIFLCIAAACLTAPMILIDDEGLPAGPAVVDVRPAVIWVPFVLGAVPIFMVSSLFVAGWSAIIVLVKRRQLHV